MNKKQILVFVDWYGACSPALKWIKKQPANATGEEIWNNCKNPDWMWWILDNLDMQLMRVTDKWDKINFWNIVWKENPNYSARQFSRRMDVLKAEWLKKNVPFSKIEKAWNKHFLN